MSDFVQDRHKPPSPLDRIVLNEIMFHPTAPGGQYVELYNTSTSFTFDLTAWQIQGLSYTFPAGSLLGPNNYLLLAADRTAFANAYGAKLPILDTFTAPMPASGETLALVQPGSGGLSNLMAEVRYESTPPWPAGANGQGSSLQLIDPRQDNWRVANWAGNFPPASRSPAAANPVSTSLPPFPPLWLNELQADNLTGITNSAGERGGWLELYNPTTNLVSLSNLCLSVSYTNLAQWTFPSDAVIAPSEFTVVFTDGQVALSNTNELHTSFALSSGTGALVLSQLDTNGQSRVLDYLNYTNLGPNHSYGSFPDGQSFVRQEFFYATPGAANDGGKPLPIAINEWMAGNTHTLTTPIGGKFDDWFELYNYGTSAVDLENPRNFDNGWGQFGGTWHYAENGMELLSATGTRARTPLERTILEQHEIWKPVYQNADDWEERPHADIVDVACDAGRRIRSVEVEVLSQDIIVSLFGVTLLE